MTLISAILPLSVFFTLLFSSLSRSNMSPPSSFPSRGAQALPLRRTRARPGTHSQSIQGQLTAGIRERESYKSLSNSISISIFHMRSRLFCKRASSTELTLQLRYNTDVLPWFTCSVSNYGFVNVVCLVFFHNIDRSGCPKAGTCLFVQHPAFPSSSFQLPCFCVSSCVFVRSVGMAVTSSSGTSGNTRDTLLNALHFLEDFAWGCEEPSL